MITGITQRIGYVLSTMLYAIMGYLIAAVPAGAFIYKTLQAYREHYKLLDADQQSNITQLLRYDNVFVAAFGLFLLSYAYNLRTYLRGWVWVVTICTVSYMICDWWENCLLSEAIKSEGAEFCGFYIAQVLKWTCSLAALITCLLVDAFKAKRGRTVLLYTIISTIIILVARFVIPLF
ncbi:MAG: hypothetical protein KF862_00155 [Chitinophagaceae bacterium]|nr:hypothetical protein [Chitinophagaceae bacterium]